MKRIKQIHGFTLLEVLVAMSIIAVMIGLLIPAIGKIQTMALVVKQRAQFNAIGVALEGFRSDSGWNDYPPSTYTDLSIPQNEEVAASDYTGAQKLAEALIGWDGFGFHPKSQWRSDGSVNFDNDSGGSMELIYDVVNGVKSGATTLQTPAENLACRKGPYLEMEKANAIKISSLYAVNGRVARDTYVLADMFRTVKNLKTGGRTGMPILYFKADTTKTWSISNAQGIPTVSANCIYNSGNNSNGFILTSPPWNTAITHPMVDPTIFYRRIKNPNFPGTLANNFADARPYRADSFILLSAGPDGLYGTADDIYNFDENE